MASTLIGIDTGGTFTDFVILDDGRTLVHKELSTPDDPARAILAGLDHLGLDTPEVVHGSTVATNALLERRGARTALVTTSGFEDVLEIGRQARPEIYDLFVERPEPPVPSSRRFGVRERTGPHGEVIVPTDAADLDLLARLIVEAGVDSVAICLLHSYAAPEHERLVLDAITSEFDGFITVSHEVLPEFREYERTCTTVANAYVGPVMRNYLENLEKGLGTGGRARIMQSNGGSISIRAAAREPVRTILSGPAGGVVGGFEVARASGFDKVITFDMGGTSTDVALCRADLPRTPDSIVGGVPIRLPVLDIHTVGAGGGSIAFRDPGGSLRVGPRSAGADPGPICYGLGGEEVTVTDANLFLGRLSAGHFLGGHRQLDVEPVVAALGKLATRFGIGRREIAEGILRVANATMEGAVRVTSVERGHDPREFTLVSFGGAGAMHAADLAVALSIPRVVVPRSAGALSALGMLLADQVRDYSRTLLRPTAALGSGELEAAFVALEERAQREFAADGVVDLRLERSLDLRYFGQGFELEVPAGTDIAGAFHDRHRQRYGYADPERLTEVVNVRVRAVSPTRAPDLERSPLTDGDASGARLGDHRMVFAGEEVNATLYERDRLRPGNVLNGPALVIEYSTTTVVPPHCRCSVDTGENLILDRGAS